MIGDTTSECDGVSATAVQSSSAFSAFSAAIDRGTGGVEGVGIMEVCRGACISCKRCSVCLPLRNRFGRSQLGHNLQRVYRDIRLVRYFPAEALCEPLFRVWHFFWRMKNKK